LDILNKFQETNEEWDTEKCPGAMALRAKEVKLKPKVKEEKEKPGIEKEDKMTGNLSSKANLSGKASNKQTILYALMVAALFPLFA